MPIAFNIRPHGRGITLAAAASCTLFLLAGPQAAHAGSITDASITMNVSSDLGSGELVVPFHQLRYDAEQGIYTWHLEENWVVQNDQDELVAIIFGLNAYVQEAPPGRDSMGPVMHLGFSALAGLSDIVAEGYLTAWQATPMDAAGATLATATAADNFGDGVSLTGLYGDGKLWDTRYDLDQNPPQKVFSSLLDSQSAGAYGRCGGADEYPPTGFAPFASQANVFETRWGFGLTARDVASGAGTFTVVPEPGALSLLLASAALLLRRRT